MAVKEMTKLFVYGWRSSGDALLEILRQRGTVQIQIEDPEDGFFKRKDTQTLCDSWEKTRIRAVRALEILDGQAPEKTSVFSSLKGKQELSQKAYKGLEGKIPFITEMADTLIRLWDELGSVKAKARKLKDEIERLEPWLLMDISPKLTGTRYTALITGTLPGAWDEPKIRQILGAAGAADAAGNGRNAGNSGSAGDARNDGNTETAGNAGAAAEIEILNQDASQTCFVLLCLLSQKEALEENLRLNGFVRAALDFSQPPAKQKEALERELSHCEKRQEQILKEIHDLAGARENLRFLEDHARGQIEKYQLLGQLLQSDHVIYLSGYTPKDQASQLTAMLESRLNCVTELEPVPEDEAAPVLLSNNAFAGPAQGVVESYGLPGKNEIDPTSIMALFYYFFFGLMLSDAGYGLIMVIGCFAALKKYPKMPEGIKNTLTMFFYCGISTTIWGILFGGYFGDVIPVAAEAFFNIQVTVPALWFAPLDDPMKLLVFSFLFGIIHLFTGLGIKGCLLLKDKKYMDCLCEVGFWYMLLVGLILLLLPSSIFASMAGTVILFPTWVHTLSMILTVVGAAGIVFMAGRRKKNFGLRLALGAYELYGVTSWLSDVLSYSRLLALGIATGVIASVINTMGVMMGSGIGGVIAFAVIFAAGHTLNLAINLLGAYVHTNRLQYVEFFGKFYEGDGEAFRPFSDASNKYIKVKEED